MSSILFGCGVVYCLFVCSLLLLSCLSVVVAVMRFLFNLCVIVFCNRYKICFFLCFLLRVNFVCLSVCLYVVCLVFFFVGVVMLVCLLLL